VILLARHFDHFTILMQRIVLKCYKSDRKCFKSDRRCHLISRILIKNLVDKLLGELILQTLYLTYLNN